MSTSSMKTGTPKSTSSHWGSTASTLSQRVMRRPSIALEATLGAISVDATAIVGARMREPHLGSSASEGPSTAIEASSPASGVRTGTTSASLGKPPSKRTVQPHNGRIPIAATIERPDGDTPMAARIARPLVMRRSTTFTIGSNRVHDGVGQELAVVGRIETLLLDRVRDIARLEEGARHTRSDENVE